MGHKFQPSRGWPASCSQMGRKLTLQHVRVCQMARVKDKLSRLRGQGVAGWRLAAQAIKE
jgi:hypothetical protein